MTEKSHVGMGYSVCPICGKKHDEVVLLDKRLKASLEREQCVGISLCPEHEAMSKEFLALVEVRNGGVGAGRHLKPQDADMTGQVAHVKRDVVSQIFNVTIPADMPMIYVEEGVIAALKAKTEGGEDA
jgi:hypothetical protein